MSYWAAGSAAVGAVSGLIGNKGSSHANDPMNPADRYGFGVAGDVGATQRSIGQLQPMQYYPNSTVAAMNPMMAGSINNLYGWGQPGGMGNNMMNLSYGAGQSGLGAMNSGLNLMNTMQNQPGGPFQYDQSVYNQTMGNLMPAMQGTYDAATRDNNRNLNWSQLPGLNMAAQGAGQEGSSKLGQNTALAQGMTMDRNQDIGAQIYQNATNQAQQAAMAGGAANLNANTNLIGQYGNYTQLGGNLMNQAFNMGGQNMGYGLQGAQLQQGYDQSQLNDQVARWNYNQQSPYNFIQNKMGLYNSAAGTGQRGAKGPGDLAAATNGAFSGLGAYMGMSNLMGGMGGNGGQSIPGMNTTGDEAGYKNGLWVDTNWYNQ